MTTSSLRSMKARLRAIDARFEVSHAEKLYQLLRESTESKIERGAILAHLGLPRATAGQFDEGLRLAARVHASCPSAMPEPYQLLSMRALYRSCPSRSSAASGVSVGVMHRAESSCLDARSRSVVLVAVSVE